MVDSAVECYAVEGLSEYEQLRLENIRRNQAFLTETLGLSLLASSSSSSAVGKKRRRNPISTATAAERQLLTPKRTRTSSSIDAADDTCVVLRRSSRVATLPSVNYTEASLTYKTYGSEMDRSSTAPHSQGESSSSTMNIPPTITAISGDLEAGTAIGWSPPPDSSADGRRSLPATATIVGGGETNSSCADLPADIDYFLQEGTICRPVEETGKAAVMLLSNFRNAVPRFNKYPGAVEWANCVFLWVNIIIGGTGGSQYSNAFSAEGRHMMWYGGSKMHKDSKVIKRLVTMTAPVAEASSVTGDCCLLFVRFEGAPYACLGRLRWIGLDLLSSPVKIKWELLDYDRFHSSGHFQSILRHGR